ncbi:MAG: hypothetical protein RI894_915 [Bacteroidota bacterium]|jgi:uncharacterized protein YebE (UPF0316 family)
MDFDWFGWIVLPILIFVARTCDMSLTTMRGMFLARGIRTPIPIIAFIESLIFIIVVSYLLKHLSNPLCYLAYAGGFAMGTIVGMRLERWLALGTVLVRTILNEDPKPLVEYFWSQHWGITVFEGAGYTGKSYLLLSIVKRKDLPAVLEKINEIFPAAFYSIEDVKAVRE